MSDICKEINKFGKGIGNEARYRILQVLMKGSRTANELVLTAKLSQPAVSQHLKTLKAYGLVTSTKKGQEVWYEANTEYTLKLLATLVQNLKKDHKK